MATRRLVCVIVVVCLQLTGGCSSTPISTRPRRQGPKVNIPHFISNAASYRGKSMTLRLKIDEPIIPSQGQTLRDYVGRDVKFMALGPKGEHLNIVIAIPADLPVPEAGQSDEAMVTFACTRGELQQGNVARLIETLP